MQLNKISAILKDLALSNYGGYYGDALESMHYGNTGDPAIDVIATKHQAEGALAGGPAEPAPKSVPDPAKIKDWNDFLVSFGNSVKTDNIDPASLDKGPDTYARNKFAEFSKQAGKNYDYESTAKEMQTYFNDIYNCICDNAVV